MKMKLILALATLLFVPQALAFQSLVTGESLEYIGSFDVPNSGTWKDPPNRRLDYSLGTIGYREDRNALYVVTHAQKPDAIALIGIPEKLSISSVAVGTLLEKPIDLPSIPNRQGQVRGLFWDQPTKTLYYNLSVWYNVEGNDYAGMGAMREGEFSGLWFTAHNNASGGYITRDTHSGQLVVGNAIGSGLNASSLGPAAISLQLDENKLPEPGARIDHQFKLFHPHGDTKAEPEKYAVMSNDEHWLHGLEVAGGTCVDGSLLIAVDEGERTFYGTTEEFQNAFGFTPRLPGKGYHNDRYSPTIWMYSLEQMEAQTKKGDGLWRCRPYEYFQLSDLPAGVRLGGMTYDATNRRLFVSQSNANQELTPRIHVFQIK